MGLAGGWALGMAGGVYQTVFANPLASPDLTGVSSGASLGAAAAIVLGAGGRLSVTLFSFAFGMAALAAVLGLVSAARLARTGRTPRWRTAISPCGWRWTTGARWGLPPVRRAPPARSWKR